MTVIVLLAFAAHVVAWLALPDGKVTKAVKEAVHTSRVMQPSAI